MPFLNITVWWRVFWLLYLITLCAVILPGQVKRNLLNVSYHIAQYTSIISDLRSEIQRLKKKIADQASRQLNPDRTDIRHVQGNIPSVRSEVRGTIDTTLIFLFYSLLFCSILLFYSVLFYSNRLFYVWFDSFIKSLESLEVICTIDITSILFWILFYSTLLWSI